MPCTGKWMCCVIDAVQSNIVVVSVCTFSAFKSRSKHCMEMTFFWRLKLHLPDVRVIINYTSRQNVFGSQQRKIVLLFRSKCTQQDNNFSCCCTSKIVVLDQQKCFVQNNNFSWTLNKHFLNQQTSWILTKQDGSFSTKKNVVCRPNCILSLWPNMFLGAAARYCQF